MTTYLFRGGHLDGTRHEVGSTESASPADFVRTPHPDDTMAVLTARSLDDIPADRTLRHVVYYRTRVGSTVEYWTAEYQREHERRQPVTLAERVATIEARTAAAEASAAALAGDFAELRRQFDAFIDALNSTSTVPSMADEYASRLP